MITRLEKKTEYVYHYSFHIMDPGTPFAAAHAFTRRAKRPAIRCVSSSCSSPSCSRRHHDRNPPGLWPSGKYAFSTIRSTQSYEPVSRPSYRSAKSSATRRP